MSAKPQGFSWKLPDSPTAKEYRELVPFLDELRKKEPKVGMAWFAAIAETDFWFWQWQVMSLGKLQIRDHGHRHFGKPWVMEPWFFDRMREFQEDLDSGRSMVLYQFGRGMFKSSAIQKGGVLFCLARDRTSTHAIFTHKADQTGEGFGKDYKAEITSNKELRAHWPQFRDPQELSTTRVTLQRPPGIREPSIAIYGILTSAASGHFRYIWVDDGVAPEEHSPVVLAEIDSRLSMMAFIGHDDTQRFWIGVPSCEEDPIEKRRKKGTFFKLVRRHPGIEPGGKYPLRSKRFYDQLRTECREDHFASQVELRIVPPGMQYFRVPWLRCYHGKPEQAAEGCRIHILIDPAEGKRHGKRKSDFLVIEVKAFTYDKRRRSLDLWRERIGISEAMDLLFGPLPGEEKLPENAWKVLYAGKRGLVGKWKRFDPNLTVWVENVGGSSFDQTIKREMKHRRRHDHNAPLCLVKELRSQIQKEDRIANTQPDYRNGVLEFPLFTVSEGGGDFRGGYGHGSFTTEDDRDVLEQLISDEYKVWTLSSEILNDDMLDLLAWPSQPGISMGYPEIPEGKSLEQLLPQESDLAAGGAWGAAGSWGNASWRVA